MCLLCSILFGEGGRARGDRPYPCGSSYSGCGGCASAYSAAESNGASASASGAVSPALSRGCGCGTYAAALQLCAPCCCTGFGRHGDCSVCCDEAYYCRQYALCCGRCKKVCCCERVYCGRC